MEFSCSKTQDIELLGPYLVVIYTLVSVIHSPKLKARVPYLGLIEPETWIFGLKKLRPKIKAERGPEYCSTMMEEEPPKGAYTKRSGTTGNNFARLN